MNFDDFFAGMDKYDSLKKGDLANIPDEELREAVLQWIWSKFDEDWLDEVEVVDSLPKPCQYVYACCTVVDEVYNGGFNQLFFNSTGFFAELAAEGFEEMGNPRLAEIVNLAIEVYENNIDLLEQYDDGTIEGFSASYEEHLFDDLDDEFYDETVDFEDMLIEYIRANEKYFGD